METLASSIDICTAMEQLENLLNQNDGDSVIEIIREFKKDENLDSALLNNIF